MLRFGVYERIADRLASDVDDFIPRAGQQGARFAFGAESERHARVERGQILTHREYRLHRFVVLRFVATQRDDLVASFDHHLPGLLDGVVECIAVRLIARRARHQGLQAQKQALHAL